MHEKCCFSFVPFFDLNVIVTPVDVHNCELGAPAKMVDDLGNKGGYISVLFCPFVDGSVVLYWSKFSILFFYKEEVSCIG